MLLVFTAAAAVAASIPVEGELRAGSGRDSTSAKSAASANAPSANGQTSALKTVRAIRA
jgi:hypothetical protein